MTTEQGILDAVERHLTGLAPAVMIRQVQVQDRRLDALVIEHGGERHAIEAKVTREDFLRESDPKRAPAERFAHRTWYAAPPGVIAASEVPADWGLLVTSRYHVVVAAAATLRRPAPLPEPDVTVLTFRLAYVERRLREDPAGAPALAAEVERLQGVVSRRDAALARAEERVDTATAAVHAALGERLPCDACGEPVTYRRVGRWVHVGRGKERACEARRAEQARLERERETMAAYGPVPAPPVMPVVSTR